MTFHKNLLSLAVTALFLGLVPASVSAARAEDESSRRAERMRLHESVWKKVLESRSGFVATAKTADGDGSISGFVGGLDSAAVSTAYVEAVPLSGGAASDSVSEPYRGGVSGVDPRDFSFSIAGLPPGPYWVYAWADGYDPEYFPGVRDASAADTVTVAPGRDSGGIRFLLEKIRPGTAAIEGRIVDDRDGTPLAGAWITAVASYEPYTYGKTETDGQGRFRIDSLKSGSYILSAGAEGYVEEFYDDAPVWEQAAPVAVVEPGVVTGLLVRLEEGGVISGRVTASDGHPLQDGIWIQVYSESSGDSSWTDPASGNAAKFDAGTGTEADGTYRIAGIPEGRYWVAAYDWSSPWVTAQKWYDDAADPSAATPVDVRSGEETSGIDFTFESPKTDGTVSGRVTDLEGRPVENAQVQLFSDGLSAWGGSIWMSAATDGDGRYALSSVPEGRYYASCWAQSGWESAFRYWPDSEDFTGAGTIEVDGATGIGNVDFRLPLSPGTASIEGTVTDAAGRPLAGASIQIQPFGSADGRSADGDSAWTGASFYAWAYSDSSGAYRVKGLPAVPVRLVCTYWEGDSRGEQWYDRASSEADADPVTLEDGRAVTGVDFSLTVTRIYGSIAGTVTNAATGAPISNAVVELLPLSTDRFGFRCGSWKTTLVTDADGRYGADWLLAGTYQVSAYANGGFAYYPGAPVPELADSVTLAGGGSVTADFALSLRNDGPCVIRGTVTVGHGGPWRNGSDSTSAFAADGASRPTRSDSDSPFVRAVVVAKPAVTIQSWPESERFYNALTGEDGTYELSGLPAGEYYVWSFGGTTIPQYWDHVTDPAEAVTVTVGSGNPATGVDFELEPMLFYAFDGAGRNAAAASVHGTVRDAGGNPVASASVLLLNVGGQAVASAVTGPDGAYALSAAAGDYVLQAGKIGYATAFNGGAKNAQEAAPLRLETGSVEVDFSLASPSDVPHGPVLPVRVTLEGNFPNPFNPSTVIRFSLPAAGPIRLTVLDMRGRTVRVLRSGPAAAGSQQAAWDARDDSGNAVPSGLYLYRLEAGSAVQTGKMIFMR